MVNNNGGNRGGNNGGSKFNSNVTNNFNKMLGVTGNGGNRNKGSNSSNNSNGNNKSHVDMATILIIVLLLGFVVMLFSGKSKSDKPPSGTTSPMPTTAAAVTRADGRPSWFELRENRRQQMSERIVEEEYE